MNELRDRVAGRGRARSSSARTRSSSCCWPRVLVGGHVLLEGVPGVAKTLLANATARALGARLPARAVHARHAPVGPDRHDDAARRASSRSGPGPVFTNVLLADEINRTPPKTQAALLEAMQERQVTSTGEPRPLPDPFLVVATQNPIEYEGTYPLPEAQLDRFLVKLDVGYPAEDDERAILGLAHRGVAPATLDDVRPVVDRRGAARGARGTVDATAVDDEVVDYVVAIVRADARAAERRARREPARRACTCSPRPRRAARLGRPRLRDARRRRRASRPPCCATGSCSGPRPSSSATGPDDAVQAALAGRARPAMSPTPRAALPSLVAVAAARCSCRSGVAALSLAGRAGRGGGGRRARRCAAPPEVERERAARSSRAASRRRSRLDAARPRAGRVRLRQPLPPDLALEPQRGGRRARRDARRAAGAAATRCRALGAARRRPARARPLVPPRRRGAELLVYPDLPAARRLALAVRRGRFRDPGGRARGPLGLGTEFESVRDYLPDDDIRQVNWRATGAARPADEQPVPASSRTATSSAGRLPAG